MRAENGEETSFDPGILVALDTADRQTTVAVRNKEYAILPPANGALKAMQDFAHQQYDYVHKHTCMHANIHISVVVLRFHVI